MCSHRAHVASHAAPAAEPDAAQHLAVALQFDVGATVAEPVRVVGGVVQLRHTDVVEEHVADEAELDAYDALERVEHGVAVARDCMTALLGLDQLLARA